MDRLNFNHFYYFYIVSKIGSIKSAAEKLHVSQPTISDQLKLLEEYFECSLFQRGHRQLTPTPEGKIALEYAEKIFDLSSDATFRLRNKSLLPKKSLDIGITHFLSHYFLYDTILPLFKQQDVSVNVKEHERHLLLADLQAGKIDLVFTDSRENLLPSMDAYRLSSNKTFIVGHKKFKKNKTDFPECLNNMPFFNYANESMLKNEIRLFFSKNRLTPKIIGEADDIELLKLVTKHGHAFTIVPETAKQRFCQNSDVVVLGEINELQTAIWGIINKSYDGPGRKLLIEQKKLND